MNLLQDYASDSDSHFEPETEIKVKRESSGRNFFDTAGSASSSETDSNPEEETREPVNNRLPSAKAALSKPPLSSIFHSLYKENERTVTRVLEQHVKLSDPKPDENTKKSKRSKLPAKVVRCRAFKKGMCKFGDKCRFCHAFPDRKRLIDEQPRDEQPKPKISNVAHFGSAPVIYNRSSTEDGDTWSGR